MRALLIAGMMLCAFPAYGQTCAPASTNPTAARDEARLSWTAPTTNTDGSPVGAPLTYRVYRSTGANSTAFTFQCETTDTSTSMLAQPVGVQNYRVTAQFPTSIESDPSNVGTKTIGAPKPNPPTLTLLEQLIAWLKSLFSRFA